MPDDTWERLNRRKRVQQASMLPIGELNIAGTFAGETSKLEDIIQRFRVGHGPEGTVTACVGEFGLAYYIEDGKIFDGAMETVQRLQTMFGKLFPGIDFLQLVTAANSVEGMTISANGNSLSVSVPKTRATKDAEKKLGLSIESKAFCEIVKEHIPSYNLERKFTRDQLTQFGISPGGQSII